MEPEMQDLIEQNRFSSIKARFQRLAWIPEHTRNGHKEDLHQSRTSGLTRRKLSYSSFSIVAWIRTAKAMLRKKSWNQVRVLPSKFLAQAAQLIFKKRARQFRNYASVSP